MIKENFNRYVFISLAMLLQGTLFASGEMGPINPKFIEWQEKQKNAVAPDILKLETSAGTKATGWIPSPLPEEVHKGYDDIAKLSSGSYPVRFDLSDPDLDLDRSDSNLTPITNQSSCGVCWAFAAYGAYEGQTSIEQIGLFDFSEQNLRYTNGTEWSNGDPCSGGNLGMVTAYLVRGSGPVDENDDPYDLSAGNTYNPNATAMRYVDNVLELPIRDFANKTDIDYIKNALSVLNRPLYVSIQVNNGTAGETGTSVWDDATKSYYCDGGGSVCSSNHAVVIVGWDDNYAAQGQTGAFIVRNSWGSGWGQNGYFYVPYNDDSIALSGTIGYYEDKEDSEINVYNIYQHDTLPAVHGWGSSGSTPYWGANRYTIEADGIVKAIGFYARYSGTEYEIRLFKSISGSGDAVTFSDQVGATQSSAATIQRGWHTIKLETPVTVAEGETLIAQVKFSNPNGWPLAIEGDYPGYIDAEYSVGESFWSGDGSNFEDVDYQMKDYITDPNVAIKVLVSRPKVKNDFNGDGKADILWKKDNGKFTVKLMDETGETGSVFVGSETAWSVEDVNDFNADGKADILWKKDNGAYTVWLMDENGKTGSIWIGTKTGWSVEGTNDFNGDNKADILWKKDNGKFTVKLMDETGETGSIFVGGETAWSVEDVNDFNADGKADILWKKDNGAYTVWTMDESGKTGSIFIGEKTDWSVQ